GLSVFRASRPRRFARSRTDKIRRPLTKLVAHACRQIQYGRRGCPRGRIMHYRFYHQMNRNESATDHEFTDDATAFSFALRQMADEPIEAWQSSRMVFQLVPSACRCPLPAE